MWISMTIIEFARRHCEGQEFAKRVPGSTGVKHARSRRNSAGLANAVMRHAE